ncbi:hypothetical protein J2Z53_001499 [Clostridium moniliforme]|uniref:Lipoprotein n=1 Tax=Clostridium moniliforme TaxID=39489 RepID=A0ABS4F0Y2_9CLOT|nr:hypothetical protein [Clostridium moniliforme]MBP1889916.1 hypothetical protein [Clostridium moniliforme]
MPIPLITSIISAISILLGSAMGAWFSWLINNKMYKRKMKEEYNIIKDNREYEEQFKFKEICSNANLIRLDICTSIYQSIRILLENENYIYPIPINKNYSCAISTLSDNYSLKELSYIYQLYGIIERVNNDILNFNFNSEKELKNIINGFEVILNKIYGENFKKFLKVNIDDISYKDLYDNEYIKLGYRDILKKLDELCYRENMNN